MKKFSHPNGSMPNEKHSPIRLLLSWSSGKDSAWALHLLRQQDDIEVVGLLTTVNQVYDRVAMHAVRHSLLEAQARAVGLPLWIIPIPSPCSNEEYEAAMGKAIDRAKQDGITAMAFGDLFLEDIRQYRGKKLTGTGITPRFPLWELPTDRLAREMVNNGIRARVTCIDPRHLDPSFAGREWDGAFLSDLPESVDPCGENGEFHTFVYDGPMFRHPVPVQSGECVERDGFVFADLL